MQFEQERRNRRKDRRLHVRFDPNDTLYIAGERENSWDVEAGFHSYEEKPIKDVEAGSHTSEDEQMKAPSRP